MQSARAVAALVGWIAVTVTLFSGAGCAAVVHEVTEEERVAECHANGQLYTYVRGGVGHCNTPSRKAEGAVTFTASRVH